MTDCYLSIEVEDGEVERILKELTEAQEKIRVCYDRLEELGVLKIKKPPSANDD